MSKAKQRKSTKLSKVTVNFIGGNATGVTGSSTLINFRGMNILLELGMVQEGTIYENFKKNDSILNAIKFDSIDYIILCDSHVDHCGMLPSGMGRGFSGKVIMTHNAAKITKHLLEDSAHILKKDAEWLFKAKGAKVKEPYGEKDIIDMFAITREVDFNTPLRLGTGITIEYVKNNHNLGSASLVMIFTDESGRKKKLFYSSDLGNTAVPMPFTSDTIDCVKTADVAIFESTYGTVPKERITKNMRRKELTRLKDGLIKTLIYDKGVVIAPVFAFQRSQQFLWHLKTIMDRTPILNDVPVVIDGRLMRNLNKEFLEMLEGQQLEDFKELLSWKNLVVIEDHDATIACANDNAPKVIVASSGMASNGKVVAYLEKFVGISTTLLVFNGYCSPNSLGARLLEKLDNPEKTAVKIGEKLHHYRAEIMRLYSFSSHMQYDELIENITKMNVSKGIYLVHGSKESREELSEALKDGFNFKNRTTPVNIVKKNMKIEF